VIRALRPEYRALVAATVSSDAFVAQASATANGAKMPRASWAVLEKYRVAIPSADVVVRFSKLWLDIISLQQSLVLQVRTLRSTRDLLLPRLLSGQSSPSTCEAYVSA
jgi:type I restriction enzyme S subunit